MLVIWDVVFSLKIFAKAAAVSLGAIGNPPRVILVGIDSGFKWGV